MNGNIYFALDTVNNSVKIGFSKHPEKRLKQLKVSNPNLKIIYTLENASKETEAFLHRYFSNEHISGEFYKSDLVLRWISNDKLTKQIMRQEGII
jgi:hypothetical protein